MENTTPNISFSREGFEDSELLDLYRAIVKPRLIEEKMLIALRQGKISKWFSGMGQEAISVGTTMAMLPEEHILTMHRNLGVFTARDISLYKLFSQFQGKPTGYTKGRDRSFHFGAPELNIVGMISHLGQQLGVADGIALANKLKELPYVTLVFSGDGGASEGDFHEALNVAAVWQLPVIFVVENNQWGLSTPSNEQFRCAQFVDKGIGYGIESERIDGNNILEVYETTRYWSEKIRKHPQPVLLECVTFRIRGHEEASGTKYYPEGLIEKWKSYDPVDNYRAFLMREGLLSKSLDDKIHKEISTEIIETLQQALETPDVEFDAEVEISDIYAVHEQPLTPAGEVMENKRLVDAISDGLRESMRANPNLVIMGQDVAEYGGVFKITDGFVNEFGKPRVRNTPLCESAIIGSGLGLSVRGMKSVIEMQFADFVTEGFTQIVNNLAKVHYRWGQNADVVIRMPTGAGVQAGPFHSQSNEAWFTHTPGLKVVYPAFPADAKGLLIRSIEDPNPVMFFEHKALYRSLYAEVPEGYYSLPIGKAALVNTGEVASIITYGMGVHWALEWQKANPDTRVDIVDLRTLMPLDEETIFASVRKTGRVLVLHEDCLTGGFGGEISARISEMCFQQLDAPVMRLGSMDTPVPFAGTLEKGFLANAYLGEKMRSLLDY
ncbi:MAG: dehydrogenase E1 component subunit alpha/beta [Cryomorphaceae bacterium]|nr:dehydrogenase E1 component subunit alpha/beta [Cryomorphaceae bacterium]